MAKIKILHVIPIFATGGAERLVLHYATFFPKDRYEIHVATCVEDGELREKFEALGFVHVYVGSRTRDRGRLGAYKKLRNYVEKIKPDIIHTHLISADLFGFFMKRKYKNQIQWVSTMHNVESATSAGRQLLWKIILKRADRVISVSERVEEFTLRQFKVSKEKSIVLRNGVDTRIWLTVPMRGLFGQPTLRLATVGRLWEQKGHIYLLRALPALKDINYELHIFGDGPLRAALEAEALKLGVSDHIIWHGITTDIPLQIKNIDVVVQPSLWEGLSLVVMEMMAAGRVVITTPAAGDELLQHDTNGFIVPAKNPEALAEKIRFIFEKKAELIQVGKEAREYARHNFDILNNVTGLQKIYQQLLR